jgi:environmental stress-induced protein Ves
MTGSVRLRRRSDYLSMPWRNGAGVTLEIARDAPSEVEFQWRLSMATLSATGPFSMYPGYRRSVTLVGGDGFRLDIEHQGSAVLDAVGATSFFPGEVATACTLLGGECRDLSLMVREPGEIIAVVSMESRQREDLPIHAAAMNAIFCLEGAVEVSGRSADGGGERAAAHKEELGMHDTLLLGPGSTRWTARPSSTGPTLLLLLAWTPAGDADSTIHSL